MCVCAFVYIWYTRKVLAGVVVDCIETDMLLVCINYDYLWFYISMALFSCYFLLFFSLFKRFCTRFLTSRLFSTWYSELINCLLIVYSIESLCLNVKLQIFFTLRTCWFRFRTLNRSLWNGFFDRTKKNCFSLFIKSWKCWPLFLEGAAKYSLWRISKCFFRIADTRIEWAKNESEKWHLEILVQLMIYGLGVCINCIKCISLYS